MVENILKGCPYLLYLNLSGTCITNKTLKELFRYVLKTVMLLVFWRHCFPPDSSVLSLISRCVTAGLFFIFLMRGGSLSVGLLI